MFYFFYIHSVIRDQDFRIWLKTWNFELKFLTWLPKLWLKKWNRKPSQDFVLNSPICLKFHPVVFEKPKTSWDRRKYRTGQTYTYVVSKTFFSIFSLHKRLNFDKNIPISFLIRFTMNTLSMRDSWKKRFFFINSTIHLYTYTVFTEITT